MPTLRVQMSGHTSKGSRPFHTGGPTIPLLDIRIEPVKARSSVVPGFYITVGLSDVTSFVLRSA